MNPARTNVIVAMIETISIFVFFFVLLVCLGAYFLSEDHRNTKRELLIRRASPRADNKDARTIELRRAREKSPAERIFSFLIDIPRLAELLAQSGLKISIERFLFAATGVAVLFSAVGILIFESFLPSVVMAGTGFALPFLFLIHKKRKRDAAVVTQLPDVLDFMVRALKSGQSLDNALRGVSVNMSDPIGGEIGTLYEEISMGLAFTEALQSFENRFPGLADIKFLCTSLLIQRETGGNLTEILEGLSRTIRQRFTLIRQVNAITAEGRLSTIFLGITPLGFGVAVYLLNPDYIRALFADPAGQKLLFLALTLEAIGFVVMRLLTKLDI